MNQDVLKFINSYDPYEYEAERRRNEQPRRRTGLMITLPFLVTIL